jgi:serine/threonine protein phosphatase 1
MEIVRSAWQPAPRRLPPGHRVAAIGDVHGMAAQFDGLLEALRHELAGAGTPELIGLGDYLDRGPDSARVLSRVARGAGRAGGTTTWLRGNHDAWLTDLLQGPPDALAFQDWLEAGGGATLRSFEVDPTAPPAHALARLRTALGAERLQALRQLRLTRRIGPYLFVHAGVHPIEPLETQGPNTLLWIRDPFLDVPEAIWAHRDLTVVHGHTPRRTEVRAHRIGVDSGAPFTGVLSAVVLEADRLRYLSAVGAPAAPPPPGAPGPAADRSALPG